MEGKMDRNLKKFLEKRKVAIEKLIKMANENGNLKKLISGRSKADLGENASFYSEKSQANSTSASLKEKAEEMNKTVAIVEALNGKCPLCNKGKTRISFLRNGNIVVCKNCALNSTKRRTKENLLMSKYLDIIIKEKDIPYTSLEFK